MKNLKKFASAALALVMAIALMVPAFAAEAETFDITIKNDKEGHTYEAYQIFSGTLSQDGKTLSDVKWGSGVTLAPDDTVAYPAGGEAKTAAEIAKSLEDSDDAAAFAKFIAGYLADAPDGSTDVVTGGKYVISGLEAGYYLVKDAADSLGSVNDTYTGYILEVVTDVEVEPKTTGTPIPDKDSEGKKKVEASVGDVIPFTLTATLPNRVSEYTKGYKLVFIDTLTGLDVDVSSIKISVNGTPVNYDPSIIRYEGNTLTVTIGNVKDAPFNATNNSKITVNYNATLNSTAISTDSAGNTLKLEYSNDPNGDSTGETEEVEVKVYSYEIEVNKTDGTTKEALAGVKFKLYRMVDDAKEYAVVENGVVTGWNAEGTELTTNANGKINIDGLGNGTYYLEETAPLDGYNKIDDVEVVINGAPAEGTLSATVSGKEVTPEGEVVPAGIENNSGALLPSTGGIGTTIFYVVGGILVVGAAVLLITRKRVRDEQ